MKYICNNYCVSTINNTLSIAVEQNVINAIFKDPNLINLIIHKNIHTYIKFDIIQFILIKYHIHNIPIPNNNPNISIILIYILFFIFIITFLNIFLSNQYKN